MGKTSLALNIAQNVALRSKQPVAVFSLDGQRTTGAADAVRRSRIEQPRFRSGQLREEDR